MEQTLEIIKKQEEAEEIIQTIKVQSLEKTGYEYWRELLIISLPRLVILAEDIFSLPKTGVAKLKFVMDNINDFIKEKQKRDNFFKKFTSSLFIRKFVSTILPIIIELVVKFYINSQKKEEILND